jgi:hypothetical protein
MLTYLFCMIFACQEADKTGFSTSGTGINPNDLGPTDDGNSEPSGGSGGGNGTGGGEDLTSGDLEGVDNDDAPLISGVDAFFTEYEGQGDLIEVHIYYTDTQDDIEGGTLALSYSNSDTSGSDSISLDSENASANLEEGEVTVLFANVDTSQDYQFRVRLQDVAGNQSNEYTAVAPAAE